MDNLIPTVIAVLTATPLRWTHLTGAISRELLARPPAPGEWPALGCLQHLIDTEQNVFPVRLEAFLAGRDFAAFDPNSGHRPAAGDDPAALAAQFAQARTGSLLLLSKITPGDLARRARHAELGPATLEEMLHQWAAHDLMHTVQAERALMQPFIAASGPWRSFFRDHDVEAPKG